MSILNRIKKIEIVMFAEKAETEKYPLTLEQWKRYANGDDISAEMSASQRTAFSDYRSRADARMREAAETMAMFEDE